MAQTRQTTSRVAGNGLLARGLDLQALAQMQIAKADERFPRVEERLAQLEQGMATVVRMLEDLPEALRDKIGFGGAKP